MLLAGYQKSWSVWVARWLTIAFAVAYVTVLGAHCGEAEGGLGSLPEVMRLFTNRWVALGGWIHYLAFDQFVGAWIVTEGQRDGLHWWRVLPALPLTFPVGPAGLSLFAVLRGKAS